MKKCLATLALGLMGTAMAAVPRPEYPRPQFERDVWVNLNGEWTCELDLAKSGGDAGRELWKSKGFAQKIVVPFCPESKLSGVGHTDFIPQIWYHRAVTVPAAWTGKRILLNFGAVDYGCEIYMDGKVVGFHFGGSSSFSVDVTRFVRPGSTHDLVVRAWNDPRGGEQPHGKQSNTFKSYGCLYTRVTGIWQTVWMEAVAPNGLASCRIVPDLDNGTFAFVPQFHAAPDGTLEVVVRDADGETAGRATVKAANGVTVTMKLGRVRPWSPASPHLYDVVYTLKDAKGAVVDMVRAYAGLRKFHVADGKIYLNNSPIFLSMVLDQGYYPDGAWTAPTDAALKRDIELSLAAGFNAARLHQKVFEERFHYWADRLGYLTWGEMPSWGVTPENPLGARNFLAEWSSVVERDANHPSIVVWTPFNETYFSVGADKLGFMRLQDEVYELTKRIDPTRPVNTASGGACHKTDIWSVHNYWQSGTDGLKALDVPEGEAWTDPSVVKRLEGVPLVGYVDQPYLVDEFGGLKWVGDKSRIAADNTWGYGGDLKSAEAVTDEIAAQAAYIMSLKRVQGFCYTQLTDVEQEQNGIYYYDRTPKFDMGRIRNIFSARKGE